MEDYIILTQRDIQKMFGFGKNKTSQLLCSGVLPIVKIGRHYRTTHKLMDDWFERYKGKEIFL